MHKAQTNDVVKINNKFLARAIAVALAEELDPEGKYGLVAALPKAMMEGKKDDYDPVSERVVIENPEKTVPVSVAIALVGQAAVKIAEEMEIEDLEAAMTLRTSAADLARSSLTCLHWRELANHTGWSKRDGKVVGVAISHGRQEKLKWDIQRAVFSALGVKTIKDIPKALDKFADVMDKEGR